MSHLLYIIIVSHDDREAFPGLTVYTGTKFFWAGAVKSLRSAELNSTELQLSCS